MSQWFLDIPKYAQELVDGLDTIDFPENVAAMQKDWLGRSEGAEIIFEIEGSDKTITVFTTRPDTLFGVTFITLAPEHPLAKELVVGTRYESDWQQLHDEVSVMAEFDRIKNMNKKQGVTWKKRNPSTHRGKNPNLERKFCNCIIRNWRSYGRPSPR